MKENSLSEENKTEIHGDRALFTAVFWKHVCLIVPRSIQSQTLSMFFITETVWRARVYHTINYCVFPSSTQVSNTELQQETFEEMKKKPRVEKNYKDVNGKASAGFSILDKTWLCYFISIIICLKQKIPALKMSFNLTMNLESRLLENRTPSKY